MHIGRNAVAGDERPSQPPRKRAYTELGRAPRPSGRTRANAELNGLETEDDTSHRLTTTTLRWWALVWKLKKITFRKHQNILH